MKIYRSGLDFEDAIFGRHSSGENLFRKFSGSGQNFSKDIKRLIKVSIMKYPETVLGKLLFLGVEKWLRRLDIRTNGLVFLSAIDTKVDLRHFADGVFYLPSAHQFPVTVDAFNINPATLNSLRELWIDAFDGELYSETHFQNDLFRYKRGLSKLRKNGGWDQKWTFAKSPDFREYVDCGRPENHFILTPLDTGTRERRMTFAKLIAGYFAKVAKSSNEEMALISH